jgi:hypothetical protein
LVGKKSGKNGDSKGADASLVWLAVAVGAGVVATAIYALQFGWSSQTLTVLAIALLTAGASLLVGVLLGFLFGIPRASQSAADSQPGKQVSSNSALGVNTNLEQISDWLTKILVGVGLIELGQLSNRGAALVSFIAPALGGDKSAPAASMGILVYFSVAGFLLGFLGTRLHLGPAFSHADQRLRDISETSAAALEALATKMDRGLQDLKGEQEGTEREVAAVRENLTRLQKMFDRLLDLVERVIQALPKP